MPIWDLSPRLPANGESGRLDVPGNCVDVPRLGEAHPGSAVHDVAAGPWRWRERVPTGHLFPCRLSVRKSRNSRLRHLVRSPDAMGNGAGRASCAWRQGGPRRPERERNAPLRDGPTMHAPALPGFQGCLMRPCAAGDPPLARIGHAASQATRFIGPGWGRPLARSAASWPGKDVAGPVDGLGARPER